ncbi:MAG: Rieske (2Fe-2S) protein [Acidobacteriota bacterium]|nr:Rieske (2Fe-2S) protein [Acidobacteriota bacterium]MDH3523097.1 Rieske (2Fe-2S) protein [Acidobacteriota bacterium]
MNEPSTIDPPESAPDRRRLLTWLARGFLSLWGLGFAWLVTSFLKPPRSQRSLTQRVIELGPLESMPVGRARMVRHGRDPVFVVRTDESTFVGLSGVCTHLRCVLTWDEDVSALACPCHNGAFDLSGNVTKGPPPRPLTRYRVETSLGKVYLHL